MHCCCCWLSMECVQHGWLKLDLKLREMDNVPFIPALQRSQSGHVPRCGLPTWLTSLSLQFAAIPHQVRAPRYQHSVTPLSMGGQPVIHHHPASNTEALDHQVMQILLLDEDLNGSASCRRASGHKLSALETHRGQSPPRHT